MVDELIRECSEAYEPETETMESIMEQFDSVDIHRGKVVEGTIVDAREDGWLVDVGYKCEGFLPRREWTHRVLVETVGEPEVGAKVRVQVTNVGQGEDAQLSLSRWRCEFDERWTNLEEKLAESEILQVQGIRKVKGGLIVDCCGIEGFIPISHLAEEGRGINPARLLEQAFPVKMIEKDRRKRRLVLSRRSMLEEELSSATLRELTVSSVAGSASDLLQIGRNLHRCLGVDDESHIWDVNAHPEGVSSDHHSALGRPFLL